MAHDVKRNHLGSTIAHTYLCSVHSGPISIQVLEVAEKIRRNSIRRRKSMGFHLSHFSSTHMLKEEAITICDILITDSHSFETSTI